jgi:hypothetical protein
MDLGLTGLLLIAGGLLIIVAALLSPWISHFFFYSSDIIAPYINKGQHRSVHDRQRLLARREAELTKTADLRLEELIHAGELEQALALAREHMREMHEQGRAEPEALYRRYIAELEERLGRRAEQG